MPRVGPESLPVMERRKDVTIASHLDHMDNLIKSGMFGRAPQKEKLNPSWKQRVKRTARPPTPTCDPLDADDAEGEKERALLLLQKLLRGRAVQNFMYEGKDAAPRHCELRMDEEAWRMRRRRAMMMMPP